MYRVLVPAAILVAGGLLGCGDGPPRWYTNCGGCGFPPTPPDGGWGPGTCTTQELGALCADAGETCSVSADPCVPVVICTLSDPASHCGGPIP